jgi:hypothetical protein
LLDGFFRRIGKLAAQDRSRGVMVGTDRASLTQRQVRLDQRPLFVGEVFTRHGAGLSGSEIKAQANPVISTPYRP